MTINLTQTCMDIISARVEIERERETRVMGEDRETGRNRERDGGRERERERKGGRRDGKQRED
jgi:hypothetical protein